MMNMMNMMKQAQNIQKKLVDAQNDLVNMSIEGTSGNGSVCVVCDGKGQFKSIKLSAEAINPDNPDSVDPETVEMLEDLITQAIVQASDKATSIMESKMKAITGGISIPGLF